jgi:hypothetical protein
MPAPTASRHPIAELADWQALTPNERSVWSEIARIVDKAASARLAQRAIAGDSITQAESGESRR